MKIIALLLSMIVLVLTIKPCCPLEEERGSIMEQVFSKHNGEAHHKDCCQDCSPFYTCGTCVGFTIEHPVVIRFGLYIKPVLHHSVYHDNGLTLIPNTIWQPPKINS